ncbi:MAG TPA: hypothetical protein P5513_03065 [Candidatus Diapherotrites archaeon]|jgi:hypothetical protein|nr:hypothetical protein [Candidatus Diapherotrites archaeon]
MQVEIKEIMGFGAVLNNLSLAQRKNPRSAVITKLPQPEEVRRNVLNYSTSVAVNRKDLDVLREMVLRQGSNIRPLKGIIVILRIKATIKFWSKLLEDKRIQSLYSNSSIGILKRIGVTKEDFDENISDKKLEEINKILKEDREIAFSEDYFKDYLQTKDIIVSYLTLRELYLKKDDTFKLFFEELKHILPYSDLIFLEPKEQ